MDMPRVCSEHDSLIRRPCEENRHRRRVFRVTHGCPRTTFDGQADALKRRLGDLGAIRASILCGAFVKDFGSALI